MATVTGMAKCTAVTGVHTTDSGRERCPLHRGRVNGPNPLATNGAPLRPAGRVRDKRDETIEDAVEQLRQDVLDQWGDDIPATWPVVGSKPEHLEPAIRGTRGMLANRVISVGVTMDPQHIPSRLSYGKSEGFGLWLSRLCDDHGRPVTVRLGSVAASYALGRTLVEGRLEVRDAGDLHLVDSIVTDSAEMNDTNAWLSGSRIGGNLTSVGRYAERGLYLTDVHVDGLVMCEGIVNATESRAADGWHMVGATGSLNLEDPGQLVVLDGNSEVDVTVHPQVEEHVAVMSDFQYNEMFGDDNDNEPWRSVAEGGMQPTTAEIRVRAFMDLVARPVDNSQGAHLGPDNHEAWKMLRSSGGLDDSGGVDPAILDLALALHPNR